MQTADFAKAEFALNVKLKDGYSKRDHLKSAWRQSGVMPDELRNAPKLPAASAQVWAYFIDLHNSRDQNGWGAQGLKYREIEAWARVKRLSLDPWELETILAIDRAFKAAADAEAEASKKAE